MEGLPPQITETQIQKEKVDFSGTLEELKVMLAIITKLQGEKDTIPKKMESIRSIQLELRTAYEKALTLLSSTDLINLLQKKEPSSMAPSSGNLVLSSYRISAIKKLKGFKDFWECLNKSPLSEDDLIFCTLFVVNRVCSRKVFSNQSGIDYGDLSRILNRKINFSMKFQDKIYAQLMSIKTIFE
jgi:hypothetical protein